MDNTYNYCWIIKGYEPDGDIWDLEVLDHKPSEQEIEQALTKLPTTAENARVKVFKLRTRREQAIQAERLAIKLAEAMKNKNFHIARSALDEMLALTGARMLHELEQEQEQI